MSIPKKLLHYLQQKKAKYEVVTHRTVYTAFDLAQTMHIKPKEVVKTLVVKLNGKEPVVVMISADKNLDKKKFLHVVNAWMSGKGASETAAALKEKLHSKARSLEFAKEAWLRKKVMGKPGATPPFGEVLKMPVFADEQVMGLKTLLLNSGNYETSLRLSVAEFKKWNRVVEGRFGIARKNDQ
ncbi:MAG: YbaK/EbsC family protein [Patescibacteria group bacterium]